MKKIILFIIVLIIIGSGAFYGGMKYAQNKTSRGFAQGVEERQQLFQGSAGQGFQTEMRRDAGLNFLRGAVIAKDEQSLTLKMPDGGSKIIFFSDSAEISKTIEGSVDDIEIGKQIIISGEENPDGSYTAKTVQLSSGYPILRNSE